MKMIDRKKTGNVLFKVRGREALIAFFYVRVWFLFKNILKYSFIFNINTLKLLKNIKTNINLILSQVKYKNKQPNEILEKRIIKKKLY
jgi:hypothetical protein